MNKKSKIVKHVVSTLTATLIAGAVVSAIVSCSNEVSSNNNKKETTLTKINANGKTYNKNTNLNISYGNKVTLSVNKKNNVVYKWYCNGQILKNVTSNTLTVSSNATINKYYAETITNGEVQKSNTITVTPTFNEKLFSAAIFEQASSKKVINDIDNTTSYSLKFELLYNNVALSYQPNCVYWTLNGNLQNETSDSFTPTLKINKNLIKATCKDLPAFYGIKNNTISANLTINFAQIQINCKNLNNNQVTVNYSNSISLHATPTSLQSLVTAGINLSDVSYQWYENNEAIKNQTSLDAIFNNLTRTATYYLKVTYKLNNVTYSLTSNEITVNVNDNIKLDNVKVVCNNNNTALNLDQKLINNPYSFSLSYENPQELNVKGTITYTLINNQTNKIITLTNNTCAINDSITINFKELNGFVPGTYTLKAAISNLNMKLHDLTIAALTITYNAITIAPVMNSNIQQTAESNIYNVNFGNSVTIKNYSNNVYIKNVNPTYQWQELLNWSWVNLKTNGNTNSLITNKNNGANQTYRLLETINNNLILISNTITIAPVILLPSEINANITCNNVNAKNNTLNIYSASNATQTLTFNISNLDINKIQNLSVDWYVNGSLLENGQNLKNQGISFNNKYNVGKNLITVNISYTLNGSYHYLNNLASFLINYYELNITSSNDNISYGTNANSNNIEFNNSYLYEDPLYQWEINNTLIGSPSSIKPTTLPSYIIQEPTTFKLLVFNASDLKQEAIISNSITITPSNTVFSATLTTPYSNTNNILDVYSNVKGTNPDTYSFTLTLLQENNVYKGSLNGAKITWTLNNNVLNSTTNDSLLSYNVPISLLTLSGINTLQVSIQLIGIKTIIHATYQINYNQLSINSNTGYDGTLSLNETSFSPLIKTAYYFWEIKTKDGTWSNPLNTTSQNTYDVSNLTSTTTFRVIVANASNLNDASIKIISDSYTLNQINTSILVNNKTNNSNTYQIFYNSNVTLTAKSTNLKTNSNITYKWYCNNKLISSDTKDTYSFTQTSSSNTFYVVLYIDNIQQTQSSIITINPTYDANDFSLGIFDEDGNDLTGLTINDLLNMSSYDLNIQLLYQNNLFDIQPTNNILWTLNNESTPNNNLATFNAQLSIGANNISVKVYNLPKIYGISNNTLTANLTINFVQLQITSNSSKLSVPYDGSISLTQNDLSTNSFNIAYNIQPSKVIYQWYEISNSKTSEVAGAISNNATFSNLKNNTTFYLVASYNLDCLLYTWTSNKITIIVEPVQPLINPKIVCNNTNSAVSLNLDKTNLNANYTFSIFSNNQTINHVLGNVVYSLINNENNETITLLNDSSSLNSSFNINFSKLNNFTPGKYSLYANINIPSANGKTLKYTTKEVTSFLITYSSISIYINTNLNKNVVEVNDSNSYNANIGSNFTILQNSNNINVTGVSTYQWQIYENNATWSNIESGANTDHYIISQLNSASSLTYRLMQQIDGLTLYSNPITINPILGSNASLSITSNNVDAINNSLSIYDTAQTTQTLSLNLNNISLSDFDSPKITWFVNGVATSVTTSSFKYQYGIGGYVISAQISYLSNGITKTLKTAINFNINSYNLQITSNTQSVSYGNNVNTVTIAQTLSSSHVYANASYQWEINGIIQQTVYDSMPTNLPSYDIQKPTTFNLIVKNTIDKTAPSIISNPIVITPSDTNLTAQINNNLSDLDNRLYIYSNIAGTTPSEFTFNVTLLQNDKKYDGTLNGASITWQFNNETVANSSNNDLTYILPISSLSQYSNVLTVSIKLVGINQTITASYNVSYLQFSIISKTGYDGFLSPNITNVLYDNNLKDQSDSYFCFWQKLNNNGTWTTLQTTSFPYEYEVTNLTQQTTYRAIIANAQTLAASNLQIISKSCVVNPVVGSVSVANYESTNNTYQINYTNVVTLNITSNVQNILPNITYEWYINNSLNTTTTNNSLSIAMNTLKPLAVYVIIYVDNIIQTTTQTIYLKPTFIANDFKMIVQENGKYVTANNYNDFQGKTTNNFEVSLVYEEGNQIIFNNNDVIFKLNDQILANSNKFGTINGLVYTFGNLNIGQNTFSVSITNLPSEFGIANNTLTFNTIINHIGVKLTSNSINNSVNYGGSTTISTTVNSQNSFTNAGIALNELTYQWYQVMPNTVQPNPIPSLNSDSLTITNVKSQVTFYLVATYNTTNSDGQNVSYQFTSSYFTINIWKLQNLIDPRILTYNSNYNLTNTLNLDDSIINNNGGIFDFFLRYKNSSLMQGTVTYTLTNEQTKQIITLSNNQAYLNDEFNINFSNIQGFVYGVYILSAQIVIPSPNGENITYTSSQISPVTITYSNISINIAPNSYPSSELSISGNTCYAQPGISINLETGNEIFIQQKYIYNWKEWKNGGWELEVRNTNASNLNVTIPTGYQWISFQLKIDVNGTVFSSNQINIFINNLPTITQNDPFSANQNVSYSSNNNEYTLNIYSSKEEEQEMIFSINQWKLSTLTDLKIDWYVNNTLYQSGNNPKFNYVYGVGTYTIDIKITYNEQTTTNTLNFIDIINHYGLVISSQQNYLSSGTNANTYGLLCEKVNNNYTNATFEWLVNGQLYLWFWSISMFSNFPSIPINTYTTFQIVIMNANDRNDPLIKSNIVTLTPMSQDSSIIGSLNKLIPSSINLVNNYPYTAAQSISPCNTNYTIQTIKNIILDKIFSNNQSYVEIGGIDFTKTLLTQYLYITLPNSVKTSNNLNGILPNVTLSFGYQQNLNIEEFKQNCNNFKIHNVSSPNGTIHLAPNYTGNSFNIEVVGFKDANINDENQAVVSALNSILNAQMQFSNTFTLTANDALDANNQSNLIDLMKQTIWTSYIENSSYYVNSSFVVNNVLYPQQEFLNNLQISLPSFVTWTNNQNGVMPNILISYDKYNLSNSNGYNFTFSNFNNSYNAINQNNYACVSQLLKEIITNNTIPLINYSLSASQSVQQQNLNGFFQAIKNAIVAEIKQNIFTIFNTRLNSSLIFSIIENLTIDSWIIPTASYESSGTIQGIVFSYNNLVINNGAYTITNLVKVNNQQNSNELNINFTNSEYNINLQNGNNLSNFSIEPEVSNWQSDYSMSYYINIANENMSNLCIGTYNNITAFTFSNALINLINNNPSYIADQYLVITLTASINNSSNNVLSSCSTKIIINNNQLFLYASSNNVSAVNLNCYNNQTYSLFFNNYLSNNNGNTYQLVEVVNQIKTTRTITNIDYSNIQNLLITQTANTGIVTYYLQELNSNNNVIATSNPVTISCSQIGGITLTNANINDNILNVNLNTTNTATLNIQNNTNLSFNESNIYYEISTNENEWVPITQTSNLFTVQFANNQIVFSNLASNISFNIKIMNPLNNLYSNIVTIQTNINSSVWTSFTCNNQNYQVKPNANWFCKLLNVNQNQEFNLTFNPPNINLSNIAFNWSILQNNVFVTQGSNSNIFSTTFQNNGTYILRLQIGWTNNYSAQAYTYFFKISVNLTSTQIDQIQTELDQFCSNQQNVLNVIEAYWNNSPNGLLQWMNTATNNNYTLAPNVNPVNFDQYFSIVNLQTDNQEDGLIQAVVNTLQPISLVKEYYSSTGQEYELAQTIPANTNIIVTTPYQLSQITYQVNSNGETQLFELYIPYEVVSQYNMGWQIPSIDETGTINFYNINLCPININNLNSNGALPNFTNTTIAPSNVVIWNMKNPDEININYNAIAGSWISFNPFFYPADVSDVTYTWYRAIGNQMNVSNIKNATQISVTDTPFLIIPSYYRTSNSTYTYYCVCTYQINSTLYSSTSPDVLVNFISNSTTS